MVIYKLQCQCLVVAFFTVILHGQVLVSNFITCHWRRSVGVGVERDRQTDRDRQTGRDRQRQAD